MPHRLVLELDRVGDAYYMKAQSHLGEAEAELVPPFSDVEEWALLRALEQRKYDETPFPPEERQALRDLEVLKGDNAHEERRTVSPERLPRLHWLKERGRDACHYRPDVHRSDGGTESRPGQKVDRRDDIGLGSETGSGARHHPRCSQGGLCGGRQDRRRALGRVWLISMSKETLFKIDKDSFRERLNKYTRRAFQMLPDLDKPHILDVGCGSGVPTLELARLSNGQIIGLDVDQSL